MMFSVLDRSQTGEIVALQARRVIDRRGGVGLELTPEARTLLGDPAMTRSTAHGRSSASSRRGSSTGSRC
jgi:hypothetical protein